MFSGVRPRASRHTRRARGSSRTHRVVSTEVLAKRTSIPPRTHPGDKRAHTRCVRPREAVEVSEAAAEDSAVVARREEEGASAAAAVAAAAAASTMDLRIPSSVRDVRPARVVSRVSARARTQREHAPNCWFTLGLVAGFFPPGRRWSSPRVRSPASPPPFHLPQRSASSCTRARARPCASSPTPRYVPSASNPARGSRNFAPGKAHHRPGRPSHARARREKGHPPRRRAPPPSPPPSPSPRIEPALTPSVPPTPPFVRARRCPTSTAPSSSRTRPRWARLRRSSDPSTPPCSPSRWRRASSRARTARAISSTSPPISSSRWSVSSRRRAAAAAAAEDAEEDAAVAAAVAAVAAAAAVPAVAEEVAAAVASAEAAVAAAVVSAADADEDAVERVEVGSRSIARRSSPRAGTSARSKPNKATIDGERRASAPEIPGRDRRRRRRRRRVDGRGATASTRRFRKPCNDEQMSFQAATRRDGEGTPLQAPGYRATRGGK